MKITILDKYIIKELLGPFLYGIAAFTAILAGSTVLFRLVGEVVKYGIPFDDSFVLFVYRLPNIMVYTFPMSMLLSTLIVFSRLSSDSELIALKSGGISFYRTVGPVLIIGFVVSLMTLTFNELVVPKANIEQEIMFQKLITQGAPPLRKNVNYTEYDDMTGYPLRIINALQVEGREMTKVTIAEFENGRLVRVIRSDKAVWLKKGSWEFFSGVMHNFLEEDKTRLIVIEFKKEIINLEQTPSDILEKEKNPEEMNAYELSQMIQSKKKRGQDTKNLEVQLQLKFSVPFACFVFVLFGAPLGLTPHKGSASIGLGLSLIIIFGYYILLSICMGMGLAGSLPPFIAAWLPNIMVGGLGTYLLIREVG